MIDALRSRYRNYLFLVPVFVIAVAYQLGYTYSAIDTQWHASELPQQPVFLNAAGEVAGNSEEARRAGIPIGARLLSVNGIPAHNVMALSEALHASRAGQRMTFLVQPRSGPPREYSFSLASERQLRPSMGDWSTVYVYLLVGLLSIGTGVYVALRLPNDISAIALFGVLAGMLQLISVVNLWMWPRWAMVVAAVYTIMMQGCWPVSMMVFGIYFPERSIFDRRRPWLKWLLIVPIVLYAAGQAVAAALAHFDLRWSAPIFGVLNPLNLAIIVLHFTAQGLFFALLARKSKRASAPDAQRRLRILWVGSAISLTPIFGLFLAVLIFWHGDFSSIPQVLEIPLILVLLIFPLALAYVVLAQRAMDLRVAIRQGIRYAFAKTGVGVIVSIVIATLMWGMAVAVFSTAINRTAQIVIYVVLIVSGSILLRRPRQHAFRWVDKRFFREAYQSELILNELNEGIRSIIDERALLQTVSTRVSESLHVPCVAILLNHNHPFRAMYAVGCENAASAEFSASSFVVQKITAALEPGPIYFDTRSNWISEAPPHEIAAVRALNAQLLLPIQVRERLLAIFSLGPKRSEEPYSKTDIQLLKSVLFQTGLALENSRLAATVATEISQREKLNREIEIAREVQERLFPHDLPLLSGLDYCGACRSALGVGGDYYDFIQLADGKIGIAVGDVSGKGIAAALLMASLQASLRGQALQSGDDLTRVMTNVNRLVFDATPENRYATFFYAQYERPTRRLTYVNAGHNPPVILRWVDGQMHVIRLETGGPVVGLFREAPYQQASLMLDPGDILIGFTDGISEAMNVNDEEWGEERMLPALEACAGERAADMIPIVMAAADRFADGAPQHDDMTLVIVKLDAA
jgi:phosphoserine phosphatase RsbU/P